MADWRLSFPRTGPADRIRTWLDTRIDEIRRGDIARARAGLEAHRWWDHFDLTRVPLYPMVRIDELVERAADYLADRALNPDGATRALQAARDLVSKVEVA